MLGGSKSFDQRLRVIEKAHRRGGRKAYMPIAASDGIVVLRKPQSRLSKLPLKGVFYLVLGFALFKGIAIAQYGPQGYENRVQEMREGTMVEQAGAWFMQPDRISVFLGAQIAPHLR